MKKTTVFTLAAVCGAFALALPDWKKPLDAAYPLPEYTVTLGANGTFTETLSVAGCKTLKTVTNSDITLYDNGSYALYRYDVNGNQTNILTGSWSEVKNKSGSTVYTSLNTASLDNLFTELNAAALTQCQLKYPAMTTVTILSPTAVIKKNTLTFKIKGNQASSALQISGKQENDAKGTLATGNFSFKTALKKGVWTYVGP